MSKQPEEMMLVGLLEYEASGYGATDYKHKVAALIRRQHSRIEADEALIPILLDALEDITNGWKYIRSMHGDLYGVGWDRAQDKADAAITALRKRLESSK